MKTKTQNIGLAYRFREWINKKGREAYSEMLAEMESKKTERKRKLVSEAVDRLEAEEIAREIIAQRKAEKPPTSSEG